MVLMDYNSVAFETVLYAYRDAGLIEKYRLMNDFFDYYCDYSYLY